MPTKNAICFYLRSLAAMATEVALELEKIRPGFHFADVICCFPKIEKMAIEMDLIQKKLCKNWKNFPMEKNRKVVTRGGDSHE